MTTFRWRALIGITGFGLALRLLLLGNAQLLWYDEAGSLWMATLPWERMIAATAGDTHPPLYIALLWAWLRIAGDSAFALRLPSALASALCIPLTYAIARQLRLTGPVCLAAAFLAAVLPAQIYYAQEARMYSLLTLEINLALYAALSRRWPLFGLALAAGYWTHNYSLLFAAPLNLVALAGLWRAPDRRWNLIGWLWANAIAFGAWLPWLSVLAGQMRDVAAGYWLQPVTPGAVLYALYMIVWAFTPGPALQAHAAWLVFGALAFAIWRAWREPGVRVVCGYLALAVSVPVGVSLAWSPVLLFRGLLPASIPICIVFAWAFVSGLSTRRQAIIQLLILPALLMADVLYYLQVPDQKGDAAIFQYVDFRPGDILYHANDGSLQIARAYAPTWPHYELPATWRDVGALSPATRAAYGVQIAPLESLAWRRAWLIYAANPMTSAAEDQAVADLLEQYVYETIYERRDSMTHQAVYLIWNYRLGPGVP